MMFALTTPSPSPTDIPTEPWEASPGVEGFLLGFFFLGIALAFLMWSMNRHLRKIKHSAAVEKRRAGEAAARSQEGPPTGASGPAPRDRDEPKTPHRDREGEESQDSD